MSISVPSAGTTVNAYMFGDRIHAAGSVLLVAGEDVIGVFGAVLEAGATVDPLFPEGEDASDYNSGGMPGAWSFCSKGVPGANAPESGTAARKLAVWFQIYDNAGARDWDAFPAVDIHVQSKPGPFQPVCTGFKSPVAAPAPVLALPHSRKSGWRHFRHLMVNNPASGNRLRDGSGTLRARQIAVYVDNVDWYFGADHTAHISRAAGLGLLPPAVPANVRWKYPTAPMYSIILHQHGNPRTPVLLAGATRKNPLIVHTDPDEDIFVQVNDVWFPTIEYTDNVGGFDVHVKVLT